MRSTTTRAGWAAAAFLVAVASFAPPAAGQARPLRTDLERDDLVGPVKTVAVTAATPADPSRFLPVETSTYSSAGWLTQREFFADGRSVARVSYVDGDDGVRRAASTTPYGFGYGVRPTRYQPRDESAVALAPGKDGSYHFLIARAYDAAGRLLGEIFTPGDDPKAAPAPQAVGRVTYRYDATGRMSERSRFYGAPGVIVEKESIAYDANDHVVTVVRYRQGNAMPSRVTYAYEFDDRGNWVTRTATEVLGGVPAVTVTKRAITYA